MVEAVEEGERALALADEAFTRGDLDTLIAHLSAAVRAFTEAGEPRAAALACARLGDALANLMGNLTAARAWFARASRLVADLPPCIEQGWVAIAAMGCDVDDPDQLLANAELALDRARRFGDVNLETKALADAGLARVQAGSVETGMALLDEAMALACGPADDVDTAAKSVCSFFTACYVAADFERADTWASMLRRRGLISLEPGGHVFLSSHCDSVQATLLVELGRWGEAEVLLERARADFRSAMGSGAWHPEIALADLRVRQGRFADAERLLLGKEQAVQALLPAARLHLARGDHDLAIAAARRGLRAVCDDRLRAVELLTLLVDAQLAAGDVEAARAACDELRRRLDGVDVVPLRARAAAAEARVQLAVGDLEAAVGTCESTVDLLSAHELPYLRAVALIDLARAREVAGDVAGARLDARAAASALAALDVVRSPADTEVLERLTATGPRAASTATLARDGKWWTVVHEGSTARLADTKGLRYLSLLVASPGVERHALDLVDAVEGGGARIAGGVGGADGVAAGLERRRLGDAGPLLDTAARVAYRRRIEELRARADDELAEGRLGAAEQTQAEIDALVAELARAFGLGGRSRVAGSVVERARLNVTRAVRTAVARIVDVAPGPGAALDRALRTGTYCCYEPRPGEIRWIVQSGVNGIGRR